MSGATEQGRLRAGGWIARIRAVATGGTVLVCLLAFGPAAAEAQQGAERLATACRGSAGEAVGVACADAALAAIALQNGYGLLMAAGGPFPASPSTAGSRLAGSPRWVLDVGTGWTTLRRPDLTDPQRPVRRSLAFAPRVTVGAGIFEGFAPTSGVGGVGAVDLIGELRVLPVPAMDGLSGRVSAWGVGTRVGVFRESFTLPGVTLSLFHRRAGTLRYGEVADDRAQSRISPRVTSLRAVAGKDLWEVGVSGGIQWDRIRGNGAVRVSAEGVEHRSGAIALPENRRTFFVGVNRTWVVAQITGELGWSQAPGSPGDLAGTGPYRGPGSSLTGALSFRVTY